LLFEFKEFRFWFWYKAGPIASLSHSRTKFENSPGFSVTP
jgi:hypothetical protein